MTNEPQAVLKGRSAARLGAVQALYQLEMEPSDSRVAINQFLNTRFKSPDQYFMKNPDLNLFEALVTGWHSNADHIDGLISQILSKDWPFERIENVLRAILRCGTCELESFPDTPKAVIINEYVNLTKTFYDGQEPGFINASLDRLAQLLGR
ncbi:MAG: transcription antitermination factor NusB [Candidatus Paracaedibacteraceae bacterium]|nr:transcription antitermination factor NusB [Candidatus Paracaedibacteraceae bacterium]